MSELLTTAIITSGLRTTNYNTCMQYHNILLLIITIISYEVNLNLLICAMRTKYYILKYNMCVYIVYCTFFIY